jgi:hypothetical protein
MAPKKIGQKIWRVKEARSRSRNQGPICAGLFRVAEKIRILTVFPDEWSAITPRGLRIKDPVKHSPNQPLKEPHRNQAATGSAVCERAPLGE